MCEAETSQNRIEQMEDVVEDQASFDAHFKLPTVLSESP
jgi:hypothetical protein